MAEHEAGDLQLIGLSKTFGEFTAVHALDLTIPQASFFALLGPSGCGKTTTLRMVAGLEEPTAGSISLGGRDIAHDKPYKRPVNTVFQSYALFPHMTIFENVAFGLRRSGVKDVKGSVHEFYYIVVVRLVVLILWNFLHNMRILRFTLLILIFILRVSI